MRNMLSQSKDFVLDSGVHEKIVPSDKIYYDYYFFRVDMPGNDVFYDVKLINDIHNWLYDNCDYGSFKPKFSSKNFRVYFTKRCDLYKFIEVYRQFVIQIIGPVSDAHFDAITNQGPTKYKINSKFRQNLYYGKYDAKVSILNVRSGDSDLNAVKNFVEYVDNNLETKQWYSNFISNYSYFNNYLYCDQKELDMHVPFLKLCYDDIIEKIEYIEKI